MITTTQSALFDDLQPPSVELPPRVRLFPQLRYMGSKARLLPWICSVLSSLQFESGLDAFSGSGCVSYLMKSMGKTVISNDFLDFARQITCATIENNSHTLEESHVRLLLEDNPRRQRFIQNTFAGIFFAQSDLDFLDNAWSNLARLPTQFHRAIALASLVRACVKKQPRGVFTVSDTAKRYDDGRRDLHLPLREQFTECVSCYNAVVFNNKRQNKSLRSDVLTADFPPAGLVYMDPPYVPRADDNCYVKRYHFLEGLVSYWGTPETAILPETKVKKIAKRYTPFSYRRTAVDAFDRMFAKFRQSILVLSYSANGYPDLQTLCDLMQRHKSKVVVHEKSHRYHFGTHSGVDASRANTTEYLIVGQ